MTDGRVGHRIDHVKMATFLESNSAMTPRVINGNFEFDPETARRLRWRFA